VDLASIASLNWIWLDGASIFSVFSSADVISMLGMTKPAMRLHLSSN